MHRSASIHRFRKRLTAWLTLRHLTVLGTAWGLSCGTAVLLLRGALRVPGLALPWWLAGSALAVVALAFALALRRRPTRRETVAWLDWYNGCGGLLMASDETELGHWRLGALQIPTLRW